MHLQEVPYLEVDLSAHASSQHAESLRRHGIYGGMQSRYLVAGQRMQVIAYGNRIEMIPEQKIGNMRGFLPGIDTEVVREDDRL